MNMYELILVTTNAQIDKVKAVLRETKSPHRMNNLKKRLYELRRQKKFCLIMIRIKGGDANEQHN